MNDLWLPAHQLGGSRHEAISGEVFYNAAMKQHVLWMLDWIEVYFVVAYSSPQPLELKQHDYMYFPSGNVAEGITDWCEPFLLVCAKNFFE